MLWLPPNGSLHGATLDRLLEWNLAALTALLLVAHLLLIYAIIRRWRASTGLASTTISAKGFAVDVRAEIELHQPSRIGAEPADLSRPGKLPAHWTAETLPTLLCCVLFAAMAVTSERLWASLRFEGASPAAMQVEVVGVQFQWYFRYPGDDARFGLTRPRMVNASIGNPLGLDQQDRAAHDDFVSSVLLLPAGREVDLRLRAHDVLHGFFIPGMRIKQNAVPGLELHVHFTPLIPGTYPILCTQVCGSGHARMQAVLRIVTPDQFAVWSATRERAALLAAQQGN